MLRLKEMETHSFTYAKKMIMNESENTQIITTLAIDGIGKVKKVCNGIL